MGLKFIVDNIDTVPEAQRGLYKQLPDGKHQLDVDGAVDKTKLDEFRNNNVLLQQQIEKYKDVDPVKYRELMSIQQKITEKQLLERGEVDELVNLRVRTMREELETQVNSHKTAAEQANQQLAVLMVDNVVQGAALKVGIQATAIDDVKARARAVFKIENGQPVPKGPDGKVIYDAKGEKPITIDYWMQDLKKTAPHLFVGSVGGVDGGGTGHGGQDVSKMSPAQKIAFGLANGMLGQRPPAQQ
jgi:hypothetical protein